MNFQFVAENQKSRDYELYLDQTHPWAEMRVYRIIRESIDHGCDRVEFYRHGNIICTVHGMTRATIEFIDALYAHTFETRRQDDRISVYD